MKRSSPPLRLHKGILEKTQDEILDSSPVLISFSNTRKENIKNSSTRSISITRVTNSRAVAQYELDGKFLPWHSGILAEATSTPFSIVLFLNLYYTFIL